MNLRLGLCLRNRRRKIVKLMVSRHGSSSAPCSMRPPDVSNVEAIRGVEEKESDSMERDVIQAVLNHFQRRNNHGAYSLQQG